MTERFIMNNISRGRKNIPNYRKATKEESGNQRDSWRKIANNAPATDNSTNG